VFLAYAGPAGRAFLDRELYLPKEWAADDARRREAGVPPDAAFATKPRLARRMLERAFAAEVPAAWVAGDAVYGDASDLRRWLEGQGAAYVLAVSCSHMIWQAGQQLRAVDLIAAVPSAAWVTLSAGAGSQGERLYDWTWVRLPYESAAGLAQWLLARRSLSDPTQLAYYRAFGPADTALAALVRVAGARWAIEENFEDAKGMAGLDQYEVRKWDAWYRHITLALLAHASLAATRHQARRAEQEKGEVRAS
jgi:SRSO17 transposase